MKVKLTIFLLAALTSITSFAQEFAPVGATWTYEVISGGYAEPEYWGVFPSTIISTKDTIVQGRNCRFLEPQAFVHACRSFYPIVTSSPNQDTVFFYDAQKDTFQVLYNFNAHVGDSWKIYLDVTYREYDITATIITKDTVVYNGNNLRKYICRYDIIIDQSPYFFVESEIIESIGDIVFPYEFANHNVGCETIWIKELRCYADTVIGDVKLSTVDCDYNNVSVLEPNVNTFQLFPNPTSDFIHLQLENTENVHYRITDITGKVMAQNTWNGQAISVENLNNGVYFITLLNKNEILGTQKIIKR